MMRLVSPEATASARSCARSASAVSPSVATVQSSRAVETVGLSSRSSSAVRRFFAATRAAASETSVENSDRSSRVPPAG